MRGKAPLSETPPERHRITPAYAGKSEITDGGVSIRRDHPRLCGEKLPVCPVLVRCSGSPPPMRGKVQKKAISKLWKKDHPRLCGEKNERRYHHVKTIGSPPPMRGKGVCFGFSGKHSRITPAYAGKSRIYLDAVAES